MPTPGFWMLEALTYCRRVFGDDLPVVKGFFPDDKFASWRITDAVPWDEAVAVKMAFRRKYADPKEWGGGGDDIQDAIMLGGDAHKFRKFWFENAAKFVAGEFPEWVSRDEIKVDPRQLARFAKKRKQLMEQLERLKNEIVDV